MIPCVDTLAGAKYPKTFKHVPHGWGVRFLSRTFGPVWGVIKRVSSKKKYIIFGGPKHPIVGLHSLWDDDHIYNRPGDEIKVFEDAARFNTFAEKRPNIQWQFSPYLEHRLPKKTMEPLFEALHAKFPKLQLVNSPIAGGDFVTLPYVINEWHHSNPAPNKKGNCQFSYDGISAFDSDVKKAIEKAQNLNAGAFWFWWWQLNLIMRAHDDTPRPLRKAVPIPELFRTAEILWSPKQAYSFPANWLWKSVSEQHGAPTPHPDDMKPVVIGPEKGTIKIVSGNKEFKFEAPEPDKHNPGNWVYRFTGKHSCNLNRRIEVYFNGGKIGIVDPCFRSGRFIEEPPK